MKIVLYIIAAVFLVIGLSRGEAMQVLSKAALICLECMGIG
jgi:hypothetical protein